MHCGLYIHIPFCIRKCAYCDFVSFDNKSDVCTSYFDALNKELMLYKGKKVDTIFIGGGTPSSIDEKHISALLENVYKNMNLSPDAEITIETNPGTITLDKLISYKKCGINRISIGMQSMQDKELTALGRIHNAEQNKVAAKLVKKAGFTNFNIDLMLSTPYQSKDTLKDTLTKALSLSPSHISAYSLIIEEGTPFYTLYNEAKLALPDENEERDMYEFTIDFLEKHGYKQYEISNFAKNGYECRHNLKYWKCMPYIGIGVAAHSYYNGTRYENTSDIHTYMDMINHDGKAFSETKKIDFDESVSEYIIMALRLKNGIELKDFFDRFGFKIEEKYKAVIEKYISGGFLEYYEKHLHFTRKGISVSNTILCDFI